MSVSFLCVLRIHEGLAKAKRTFLFYKMGKNVLWDSRVLTQIIFDFFLSVEIVWHGICRTKSVMTDAQEIKQISDYLNKERKIACEVSKDANGSIIVSIENGDWMHDHMHCERAMYDYGYAVFKEVSKEDICGDDSYSSDHYFEKRYV